MIPASRRVCRTCWRLTRPKEAIAEQRGISRQGVGKVDAIHVAVAGDTQGRPTRQLIVAPASEQTTIIAVVVGVTAASPLQRVPWT